MSAIVGVLLMLAAFFIAGAGAQKYKDLMPLMKNLKTHGVVPEIIPRMPMGAISVEYPSSSQVVKMGNTISVDAAKEKPTVEFEEKPGNKYVLMMIDPDAPSRRNPTRRNVLHWLVVNAPGPTQMSGSDNFPTFSYKGPGPPQKSGPHRYIFLAFCQHNNTIDETAEQQAIKDRPNFSLSEFRMRNSLHLPFAANFFLAENK